MSETNGHLPYGQCIFFDDIDDGFTIEGEVDERPGVHPAFKFKFRPIVLDQMYADYVRSSDNIDAMIKMLVKHVRHWAVKKPDGEPAPVDDSMFRAIKPPAFTDMRNIVLGIVGPTRADRMEGITGREQLIAAGKN